MNQRVIYEKPEGGVVILTPSLECLAIHTIEEIAAKDVPAGVPYKIINASDVPTDRTFRNAWEADIAEPDGVGAESNEFPTPPTAEPITEGQIEAATEGLEYQGEAQFNTEAAQ